MSFLAPGYPTFKAFQGTQPDIQSGATYVPVTIAGIPTPGEQIMLTVGSDVTSVQPDVLTYTVLSTDSLSSIATGIASLIEAAITAGSNPWYTDFASASATGNKVSAVLQSGVVLSTISIVAAVASSSMLDILPYNYPEAVPSSATEVTALSTFSYNGDTGVFRVYRGQRITVPNNIAQDLINEGLAQ